MESTIPFKEWLRIYDPQFRFRNLQRTRCFRDLLLDLDNRKNGELCVIAAKNGHLLFLQYLTLKLGFKIKDEKLVLHAIKGKYIRVVRWLIYQAGCPYDIEKCVAVAMFHGHLELLKFLTTVLPYIPPPKKEEDNQSTDHDDEDVNDDSSDEEQFFALLNTFHFHTKCYEEDPYFVGF